MNYIVDSTRKNGLVGLKKVLPRVFWIVSDRMCRHSSFSFFIRLLCSIKFSLFPISRVPNGDIWTQFPSIYSGDGSFLILSSSLSLSYIILLGPRTGCQENLSVCFFVFFFISFLFSLSILYCSFFFPSFTTSNCEREKKNNNTLNRKKTKLVTTILLWRIVVVCLNTIYTVHT